MERFYRFAGITFRVTGKDGQMYCEEGVLSGYRTEGPCYDHSIDFAIVHTLPAPKGDHVFSDTQRRVYTDGAEQLCCVGEVQRSPEGAYMHIRRRGSHSQVQILRQAVPDRIQPRLVLNTLEAEHHIVHHGGFLLHAAFIRWQDRAILFTAPSGTGKSTQADLWCRLKGAELINGDRVAVMAEPEGLRAYGIPFCGTSGVCRNQRLPVSAIVYLSQAPKSDITTLAGTQAFRRVWEGCSVNIWNRQDMERCSQTVMEAVQQIPVYHLACTPDGSAVAALENALRKL